MINPFRLLYHNQVRDESWLSFLAWPLLIIAFYGLGYGYNDYRQSMPAEILAHAPFPAIEQAVRENIPEGYILRDESNFRQDTDHRNIILIEYNVTRFDYSDTINYTWSWKVPPSLIREHDPGEIISRLPECELTPVSDPANSIHQRVLELIETR